MSVIAAAPCWFLHAKLVELFASYSRLIAYGAPVIITGLLFAVIGVAELVITRDEIISVILKKVKK